MFAGIVEIIESKNIVEINNSWCICVYRCHTNKQTDRQCLHRHPKNNWKINVRTLKTQLKRQQLSFTAITIIITVYFDAHIHAWTHIAHRYLHYMHAQTHAHKRIICSSTSFSPNQYTYFLRPQVLKRWCWYIYLSQCIRILRHLCSSDYLSLGCRRSVMYELEMYYRPAMQQNTPAIQNKLLDCC